MREETVHTAAYYTSTERYMSIFDRSSRKMRLEAGTIDDYLGWKKKVTGKLREITGLDRMESCPLAPTILESVQLNGYRREKWLLQTEPGVWMPVYVLIPDGLKASEKRACMITPHGHASGGKYSPASRTDIPAIAESVELYRSDYGEKFVQEGYIVFCPDARGFGERREWMLQGDGKHSFLNSTCIQLNHIAISLGGSLTGMWTWDLMRLVDYIVSRKDCDAGRIGCAGLSGGGLQTLWLAALDERIRCAVVSGYFYGYKDSLLKLSNNCGCNYVPGLWELVDMGDIGALIAPRPLLIESGTKDSLNGERGLLNVTEQLDITREAYKLWGQEERLYHHVFEGNHRWDGVQTYKFAKKWLN